MKVPKTYPKLVNLAFNMFETMNSSGGVGLAAPQIGCSLRIFVARINYNKNAHTVDQKVFINPKIVYRSKAKRKGIEGCLSIPSLDVVVERNKVITIEYYDINFKKHREKFDGFNAVVVQHEYDHLNGVLITDFLSKDRLNGFSAIDHL